MSVDEFGDFEELKRLLTERALRERAEAAQRKAADLISEIDARTGALTQGNWPSDHIVEITITGGVSQVYGEFLNKLRLAAAEAHADITVTPGIPASEWSPLVTEPESVTRKPPLPEEPWGDFTRVVIDETSSEVEQILRLAMFAADDYVYTDPPGLTDADIRANGVREAILHLLELGLIDIDTKRVGADVAWPTGRSLRR